MLIEPLLQLLNKLKLLGMLAAMQRQLSDPDIAALRFEDRLAMLLQHELADRENARFSQRLRIANLPQPACLEDLDTHIPTRHLDPAMISTVRDLGWIDRHLNVLITGPTGIGKSFIGAALAHAACRMNYHVRCFRLPRLIDELARVHAFQRRATFLRSLAKVDLLLIDDFGITPLTDQANAIYSKYSMIATTSRPRSSPANSRSSNGMPTSTIQPRRCHPRSVGPQCLSPRSQWRLGSKTQIVTRHGRKDGRRRGAFHRTGRSVVKYRKHAIDE